MLKNLLIFAMAPPPKLVWTPTAEMSSKSASKTTNRIHSELQESRLKTAPDVTKFNFNKKRTRLLGGSEKTAENGKGVGYWIHRDQRVQDNWAVLYAQKLALEHKKIVTFCGKFG